MSSFCVSRTNIDGILTLAHRWLGDGTARRLDAVDRQAIVEAVAQPDRTGRRLWRTSFDATMFGGPRALADPYFVDEHVAMGDDIEGAFVDDYVFEALPGRPHPAVGLRLVDCYRYQVEGDHWLDNDTDDKALIDALTAAGRLLLGREDHHLDPVWESTPWGVEDGDRDVFERFGVAG